MAATDNAASNTAADHPAHESPPTHRQRHPNATAATATLPMDNTDNTTSLNASSAVSTAASNYSTHTTTTTSSSSPDTIITINTDTLATNTMLLSPGATLAAPASIPTTLAAAAAVTTSSDRTPSTASDASNSPTVAPVSPATATSTTPAVQMPLLCSTRSPMINVKPMAKLMLSRSTGQPLSSLKDTSSNISSSSSKPIPTSAPTSSTASAPAPASTAAAPPLFGLIKQPPPLHINLPPHLQHHHLHAGKDTDDIRKKRRCTDRYDSSESSDSGVATLSCTDSSTASSDGSDPGSPYSPSSSSCDDHNNTQQQSDKRGPIPTATAAAAAAAATGHLQQLQLPALLNTAPGKTATTMGVQSMYTGKSTNVLPHIWPWSNNFTATQPQPHQPAPNTVASGAALAPTGVTSSTEPPPLVKGGQKRNASFADPASASASIKKIRNSTSKPLALVAAAPKLTPMLASTGGGGGNGTGGILTVGCGNPQTKITGFFKSQMKPISNVLKRNGGDLTNLVVRSTDFPKHLQAAKALTHHANIQKVSCDIDVRTAHVATNCQSVASATSTTSTSGPKKIERKTAKVAPLVPISRKSAGTTSGNASLAATGPKKPVSIAPRLELVPVPTSSTATHATLTNLRVPAPPQQMVAPMQHQPQVPITSLSPPALVSTSHKSSTGKLTAMYATVNHNPTLSLPPPPPVMPKLVQIPSSNSQQSQLHARLNNHQAPLLPGTVPSRPLQQHQQQQQSIQHVQQSAQMHTTSGDNASTQYFNLNGALIKIHPSTNPQSQPTHHHLTTIPTHTASKPFAIQSAQPAYQQQLYMDTTTGLLLTTTTTANMQMPALHPYATAAQTQQQQQQQQHQQQHAPTMMLQQHQQQMQFQQVLQQQLNHMSLVMPTQQPQQQHQQHQFASLTQQTLQPKPLHQHQQQHQQQSHPQLYFTHTGNGSALMPAPTGPLHCHPAASLSALTNHHHQPFTSMLTPTSTAYTSSTTTTALAKVLPGVAGTTAVSTPRTAMSSPPPLISTSTPPPLCLPKPFASQPTMVTMHQLTPPQQQQQQQLQQRLPMCSITITATPPVASKPMTLSLPPAMLSVMPSLTPIVDPTLTNLMSSNLAAPVTSAVASTQAQAPVPLPLPLSSVFETFASNTLSIKPVCSNATPATTETPPSLAPPPPTITTTPVIAATPAVTPLPQSPSTCRPVVLPPSLPSPKSLVLERIQRLMPDPLNTGLPRTPHTKRLSVSTSDTSGALLQTPPAPECARSPILSQPKTIRFPAACGTQSRGSGVRKSDGRLVGVCYWDDCSERYDTSSKLLDHLQTQHVNAQTGPFACEWSGCKVHGRESCSRRWLERHVLSHGGTKPFKCIVDGCGLRFGSQLALQKHVNSHFNATENQKDQKDRRSSDPPVPKKLRVNVNGKKLRYRRQPFSARMFDFFDNGVMEVLQHRLVRTEETACGDKGAVVFVGQPTVRRVTATGCVEHLVSWSPPDILPDEWLPENSPLFTTHTHTTSSIGGSGDGSSTSTSPLPLDPNLSSACSSSGASETSSMAAFSLASASAVSSLSSSSCASKSVRIRSMSDSQRNALHDYLQLTYAQPMLHANGVQLMELLEQTGRSDGGSSGSSGSNVSGISNPVQPNEAQLPTKPRHSRRKTTSSARSVSSAMPADRSSVS